MTAATAPTDAAEVVRPVFAAEQAVQRALGTVEHLHAKIASALQVLDDAAFESAKASLTDRQGFYLGVAAEHLDRLQSRFEAVARLAAEFDSHLSDAAEAVKQARDMLAGVDNTDPDTADIAQLRPRVAALGELVELARPIAALAVKHLESAREASHHVTAQGLLVPQSLERSIRATGAAIRHADEDVRLLDGVVDRAAMSARQSAGVATEISDNAARRMASERRAAKPGGVRVPRPGVMTR